MIPKIFKGDAATFKSNGYGFLRDIKTGKASEERNGGMSIELTYPVDGHNAEHLIRGNIIMAKASERLGIQPYRIFSVKKSENNKEYVVEADHYTFDAKRNFIEKWTITEMSAQSVLENMKKHLLLDNDIIFESDIETKSSTEWIRKNPLAAIAGEEGSMIQIWGGEVKRDGKKVSLLRKRGRDGSVTIRNRKDLLGLDLEENDLEVVTRIYPFKTVPIEKEEPTIPETRATKKDEEEEKEITLTLPELYVDSPHINDYPRISMVPVDFANDESVVDVETLRVAANNWFAQNTGVDIPKVTGNIQIQELSKTTEYAKFKDLVSVELCDKINVISTNIDVKIKVVVNKTVYDFIKEQYVTLEIGDKVMSYGEANKVKWDGIIKEIGDLKEEVNWVVNTGDGNRNYYGPNEPLLAKENDLWFKTKDDGTIEVYRYNGSSWELTIDPSLAAIAEEMAKNAQEMAEKNKKDLEEMIDDVANIEKISNDASQTANEGKLLAEGADKNATKALQEAQNAFDKINNLDTSTRNIILDKNITSAIPNTIDNSMKKDGYLITLKTKGALDFGIKNELSNIFTPGEAYVFGYRFRKVSGELKRIGGSMTLMGDKENQRWFLDGAELSDDKIQTDSIEAPNDTDWHTLLITTSETVDTPNKSLYIQPNRGVSVNPPEVTMQVESIYSYRSTLITNAWTPAPEDVIAEFTKINGELSSKISKTEIDDVLEQKGVATQKWTQSEIKQSSDKITAEVQKVEQSIGNMLNNSTKSGTLDRWKLTQANQADYSLETIVVNGEKTIAQKSVHRGAQNMQMFHENVAVDVGSTYEVKLSLKSSKTATNFFVGLWVADENGKGVDNVKLVNVKTGEVTKNGNGANNSYFWVGQLVEERWTDVVGYIMPSNTDPKDLIGVGKHVQSAIILPPEAKSVSIRYLNYVSSTAEEVTLHMVNPSMTRTANQTTVQNAKLTIANDAITQTVSDVKKEVDGLAPSSPPNLIDDSMFKKKGQGYWYSWNTGNRAFIRNPNGTMKFRALKTGSTQQGIDIRSVKNFEKGKSYTLRFKMSGTVSIVNPILITDGSVPNVSLGIAYITPEIKEHVVTFTWESDAKTSSLALLSPANDPKVGYMDLEEGIYLHEGVTNTVSWMPSESDILTNSGSSNVLVDTDKAKENIPAKMVIKKVPYSQKAGSFTAEPSPLNDSWTKYTTTGSGPISYDIGTSNQVLAKVGFSEYQGLETLKPGDDVTFSIDLLVEEQAVGSNVNIIFFQLLNGVQWSGMYTEAYTKNDGIIRASLTDKILPGTTGILCRVQIGTLPGNIVHMGKPSLIVGSEDLGYNLPEKEISSNISNIQQTANDITSTVSSLNYGQVNLVRNSQFQKTVGTNSVKYWLVTGITAMTYGFDSGVLKITSTRDNAWIGININVEGGVIKDEWYSFSVEYYGDGSALTSVGVQQGGPNSTITSLPKIGQFTRFDVSFKANFTSGRNVNLWVQGPPGSVHYFRKPMLNKSKIPMAYTPNVSEAGEYTSEVYQSSEQIKTTVTNNKKDADEKFSMVDQKADSIISTVSGMTNANWIDRSGFEEDALGQKPRNWKLVTPEGDNGVSKGWALTVVNNPQKGVVDPKTGYTNRSDRVLQVKCGTGDAYIMYTNDDGSDYWNEGKAVNPIYVEGDNAWTDGQGGSTSYGYLAKMLDGTEKVFSGDTTFAKTKSFITTNSTLINDVNAVKVRPCIVIKGSAITAPPGFVYYDNIVYKREPTVSQFVQLADEISLSVKKDGVISAINLSPEGASIIGKKILLDGEVTINGPAFSKVFTTVDLTADSIKTGTIDASKINVTKINANEIYTGTIKGASLEINLNTGFVTFQRGEIKRADGKFKIDVTNGTVESYDTAGGFTLKSGEIKFYDANYVNTDPGLFGYITWQWGFMSKTDGISVKGVKGWHVGTTSSVPGGAFTTTGSMIYGSATDTFIDSEGKTTLTGGKKTNILEPQVGVIFERPGITFMGSIKTIRFSTVNDWAKNPSTEIVGNRWKATGTSTHMYIHVGVKGVLAVKDNVDANYMPVQGSKFLEASSATIKQNIREWEKDKASKSAEEIMRETKAYTYALNGEVDNQSYKKQMGLVVEMSSPELLGENKDSVNLYSMTTTNWQVTREILEKNDKLEKEVQELWEVIALLKNEAFQDVTEL